jgi:hypothetical protein
LKRITDYKSKMETRALLFCGISNFGRVSAEGLEKRVRLAFSSRGVSNIKSVVASDITRPRVLTELAELAEWLTVPQRKAIVFYNGHGDQTRDRGGDEADGMDEFWRLAGGGCVLDDEISKIFATKGIASGSALLLISDSCSSGTMIDLSLFPKERGNWCTIGACRDAESALASSEGGIFTLFGLIPALDAGANTASDIVSYVRKAIDIPSQKVFLQDTNSASSIQFFN